MYFLWSVHLHQNSKAKGRVKTEEKGPRMKETLLKLFSESTRESDRPGCRVRTLIFPVRMAYFLLGRWGRTDGVLLWGQKIARQLGKILSEPWPSSVIFRACFASRIVCHVIPGRMRDWVSCLCCWFFFLHICRMTVPNLMSVPHG